MARVPFGAEGTANAMTAHAGVTAGAAAGTAAGETFAAMDAGTEVGTPGWIHAGGQTAEAGFQDPALGWVGVRADMSGGNVHAALMPGSAEAAQTLSGHLAGLNAYLAEQHTPVATLTMAARERERSRNQVRARACSRVRARIRVKMLSGTLQLNRHRVCSRAGQRFMPRWRG